MCALCFTILPCKIYLSERKKNFPHLPPSHSALPFLLIYINKDHILPLSSSSSSYLSTVLSVPILERSSIVFLSLYFCIYLNKPHSHSFIHLYPTSTQFLHIYIMNTNIMI